MQKILLDSEECAIERNFERYHSASPETKARVEKIIEESRKSRPISLRVNEKDLILLKEKANKNGLPYQTMINVVIHKYVTDGYLDKDEVGKYLKMKKAG